MKRMGTKLAVGAGAVLAVAGGGAAYAATQEIPAQERGGELKAHVGSAGFPLSGVRGGHGGPGGRHGHEGGVRLEAAASYLGVTEAALREQLHAGKTLAEVAKTEGKTVAGLVEALVAVETAKLADAVEAGRLTDTQRDQIVETLEARVTERVNGPAPKFREGSGSRGGHGFRGSRTAPPSGESGYRLGAEPSSSSTEPPAAA